MQQFFRSFEVDLAQIDPILVQLAGISQPWVLSLDRTNWSFGKTYFNILMLGVVHNKGKTIPLLWTLIDKRGNSNCDERMDLLERFCCSIS